MLSAWPLRKRRLRRILITAGAGFIGSYVVDASLVSAAFGHLRPDVVLHHAAHIHVVGSLNVWKADPA